MTKITFRELQKRQGENPLILDIRGSESVEKASLEDSFSLPFKNVPYREMMKGREASELPDALKEQLSKELKKEQPIAVVCGLGVSSQWVADALCQLGYKAYSLEGGMEEWSKFFEIVPIHTDPDLEIVQVVRPARGCLSYVCSSQGEAIVIDPSRHLDPYRQLLKGKKVRFVLDTHLHADHISGGPTLGHETGSPYCLHPYDGIHPLDLLPATFPYTYLQEGDTLTFGNSALKALHIPGHTLGNMAFLLDGRFLFAGDSLFLHSIARPDLGGKGEAWAPLHYRSINRLLALGDDILLLPGHFSGDNYAAPLREIKKINRDLQMVQKSEGEIPCLDEYLEIKRINLGLSDPSEEEMNQLEQGKNQCALS